MLRLTSLVLDTMVLFGKRLAEAKIWLKPNMETLQRTANRGSISTASYDIDNSIKFESANTESLTKSQTASNRRTWTLSFWFKRTKVDSALQYVFEAGVNGSTLFSGPIINGTTDWRIYEYVSGSRNLAFHSTVPLRDPSAWYHLVIACDTTQSDAANRFKIYLNGVNVTAISGYFSTAQYPAQNYETHINSSASTLSIGKAPTASTNFCGYISEFNFIDGLMKDAEDFGKYDSASGIWQPIEYEDSYGNEGYFLNFADAADLGDDESGNGKDFTENNITAADQSTDTPTNNFCTWNPLWVYATQPTISDGATKTFNSSTDWTGAKSTFGLTKGKWYWEYKALNYNALLGIQTDGESNISASGNAQSKLSTLALFLQGEVEIVDSGGSRDDTNVTFTFDAAHTFGIALDMDSATQIISFYQNGSLITNGGNINIDGLADQTVFPFVATLNNTVTINFGGYTSNSIASAASDANGYGTFEFAPPSGYYAICTKNLALYGG
jgi:hypothetical protein